MLKHNGLILEHNRKDFWEIPESMIGKFLSIIDAGLFIVCIHLISVYTCVLILNR